MKLFGHVAGSAVHGRSVDPVAPSRSALSSQRRCAWWSPRSYCAPVSTVRPVRPEPPRSLALRRSVVTGIRTARVSTDAQLGSIIRVITLSDGTTTYQPRAQMNLSGGAKFDARRVIGVSVARATPESFTKEFLPWHAENLTSAQRAAIMKYLRVLPSTTSPSATSGSSSDVRTMAIVESVPAGSKPTCGQPSDADGLACAPGRLDIVWMFLGDSSAPVDRYSISTRSEDDYLLAGFDSVGHWAPGNSRAATVSPGQSATTATVPGTSSTPPPGSTTSTP